MTQGEPLCWEAFLTETGGTLSASPSRALVVALQSLWVAALPGASRLLLAMLLGSWKFEPHVRVSTDGPRHKAVESRGASKIQ